jgi:hypothetical protein
MVELQILRSSQKRKETKCMLQNVQEMHFNYLDFINDSDLPLLVKVRHLHSAC